jgi:hypothetical protein
LTKIINKSAISHSASSAIGQPKSYEAEWLASHGKNSPQDGERKADTIPKKPKLSKAQSRALQEKQRADKAAKRGGTPSHTCEKKNGHFKNQQPVIYNHLVKSNLVTTSIQLFSD